MQEVKDLASVLKDTVAGLKQAMADAGNSLTAEIKIGHDNISKVKALTAGLRDANKEVEAILGATRSNYPEPEPPTEQAKPLGFGPSDLNGVSLLNIEGNK